MLPPQICRGDNKMYQCTVQLLFTVKSCRFVPFCE